MTAVQQAPKDSAPLVLEDAAARGEVGEDAAFDAARACIQNYWRLRHAYSRWNFKKARELQKKQFQCNFCGKVSCTVGEIRRYFAYVQLLSLPDAIKNDKKCKEKF